CVEWLRMGSLGAIGLPAWLNSKELPVTESPRLRNARACIQLFFLGAPPQHETCGPKPNGGERGHTEFLGMNSVLPRSLPAVALRGAAARPGAKLRNRPCAAPAPLPIGGWFGPVESPPVPHRDR